MGEIEIVRGRFLHLLTPLAVLLIGGMVSFWTFISVSERLDGNYRRLLNGSARIHAGLLTSDVDALERAMNRMSRRWAVSNGTPPEIWREEAQSLAETYPAVTAVQRLDPDLKIRWQITGLIEDFRADTPASLTADERDRITAIRNSNTMAVSDVDAADENAHITLYMPLRTGARHDGFLGVRLNLRDFFATLIKKTGSPNHIQIVRDDRTMFALGGEPLKDGPADLVGVAVAGIGDVTFDIRMLPTPQLLRANGSTVPSYVLGIGLLITLLLTFLAYFITHAVQRARALRSSITQITEQERRYSELLRRANMGVAITDPDGKVIDANEPYMRMLGVSAKNELVGRSISEFLPTGGMDLRAEHVSNAANALGVVHKNVALRQRGGQHVLISAATIADRSHDGQLRFITLAEDITESSRIQHEIAESKRIFEEVFEGSDIAITDVDMSALFARLQELRQHGVRDLRQYIDGGPRRIEEICRLVRLNNINQAGLELFGGQSVAQLKTMDYFLEGDRPSQIRDIALGIWDAVPSIRKEVNYTSFTGRNISIIYSLRLPVNIEEAQRVPVVTMDVTDIRSAELARQANMAKSQFLASMSHEIRTPLHGVIGNLELLAQTELQAEQEDLLFDAEKAAKSLLALIGNILDFSKIEAGKLTVERIDLNPALIVQEAVDIVQSRARQKGIYVTGFMGRDLPQVVKGDPTRIRQILLNLLGNAVKFTGQGGVHVNLTSQTVDNMTCNLVFRVHDSGRGFSQDMADDLFQPFTQNQKQSFEDFGGTGLGLSICKSLVETFGGRIGCESIPSQGASFWFTVPVEIVKSAPDSQALPGLASRTVMFVVPGGDAPPTKLASYIRERRGEIVLADSESTALNLSRQAAVNGRNIDLAVFVAPPSQWPTIGFAAALRDNRTIPMIYAPDDEPATWRHALRCGAAYIVTPGIEPASLDRNIHHIFGENIGHVDRATISNGLTDFDIGVLANKRVLVLEDRLVNQTIIQRQLKKLRMSCTIAGDGLIGLQRVATGSYDLILCDCSMPEMNGYDFTRILRQREREKGDGTHIPVIAMTANAFREDMEKCFASGMDDFISKPVTLQRLGSVMCQWIQKDGAHRLAEVPVSSGVTTSGMALGALSVSGRKHIAAVDLPVLHKLLGSADENVVKNIISEFIPAAKESWGDVQKSIADKDAEALRMAAHGAKGEARNMGAMVLGGLYERLERSAKEGDLTGAESIMVEIPGELQRVQDFVDDYITRAAQ